MGNSSYPKAAILKSAVCSGDLGDIRTILAQCEESGCLDSGTDCTECSAIPVIPLNNARSSDHGALGKKTALLAMPLNKKGDTALALALRRGHNSLINYLLDSGSPVNVINKEHETPLDIALGKTLPPDGDILHNHFCPYSHATETQFRIPTEVRDLLKRGAKGATLHKLILHVMKDKALLRELSALIRDLHSEDNYRLSGLMLQVAIWFEMNDLVIHLLQMGIDPENFWRSPFIPTIVPNSEYQRTVNMWESISSDTEGEYVVSCQDKVISVDSSATLQSLKLSFVQDWRADWCDGENPDAQYRAGLLLTIDGAIIMIKAANCGVVLEHVVEDILHYLPPMCGGPDLRYYPVVPLLTLAGYEFTEEERRQLSLKYNLDFDDYLLQSKQAKSLKQLCRLCIRNSFVENTFKCVPKLTCLPIELRRYLYINEIAH